MKNLFTLVAALLAFSAYGATNLATVGDKTITDEDLKSEYGMMDAEQKKAINGDAATKKNIVESAVNTELLIIAAQKSGLENDKEFKKAMDKYKRQWLATKMMEKTLEAKLSKSEVKKYYDGNKGLFDNSQVCASHILVTDEAAAKKVLDEVKAGKKKFDELAKKYSTDPSVQDNGGDLGCFTRDRMVPEFSQAAFSMKKGEIKGGVRTMYGYHVIKINDSKPGKTPGFEEVEQRAKDSLRMKVLQDYITELRSKSAVKLNDDAIKNLKF